MKKSHNSGIYESIYGNAVEYEEGDDFGYDLDADEEIPLDAIDFDIFIRDLD